MTELTKFMQFVEISKVQRQCGKFNIKQNVQSIASMFHIVATVKVLMNADAVKLNRRNAHFTLQ